MTAERFDRIEASITELKTTVGDLQGAVHTQIIREQSVLQDSDRNLAFRVEKLEELVSKLMRPAA